MKIKLSELLPYFVHETSETKDKYKVSPHMVHRYYLVYQLMWTCKSFGSSSHAFNVHSKFRNQAKMSM